MSNELAELLQQARSNEPSVRDPAWQRLMHLLHMMARVMMRENDRIGRESVDVCQSVMEDLIRQDNVPFDIEKPEAYIRKALANKLRYYARMHREMAQLDDEDGIAAADADGSRASQLATIDEVEHKWDLYRRHLDALEPVGRDIVRQHLEGSVPHRRIAEELGMGEAAVRKRYSRALRDLRILCMQGDGSSWERIGETIGLSPDRVRDRYDHIASRC